MSQGDLEGATIKDLVVMFTAIAVKQNAALEGMKALNTIGSTGRWRELKRSLKSDKAISVAR